MMWLKRNFVALLVALVFLGMIGFSVMLLFKARAQQKATEGQLQTYKQQLEEEMRKSIFPSPKNKEILEGQRRQMDDFFRDVYGAFPRNQRDYPSMPPWEFKGYLETQLRRLEQFCRTNQVVIPTGMTFGFGRYVGAKEPPKQDDTSELMHQLELTERLLRLLAQSKVVEIGALRRTYLDSETETSQERVDGGVRKKDAHLLYESQNFEVILRCNNEQLKNLLSNMATSTNLLVLVRYVSVDLPKVFPATPGEATPAGSGTPSRAPNVPSGVMPFPPPGMPPAPLPEGGRGRASPTAQPGRTSGSAAMDVPIVLGTELATVTLRLDVIEFKPLEEKNESKSAAKEDPPQKPKNATKS